MTTTKNKLKNLLLLFSIFILNGVSAQQDSTFISADTSHVHKTGELEYRCTCCVRNITRVNIDLLTNNTFSVAIGSANMYDTYLSPLEYKGFSVRLNYEQMRRTTWFNYRFYKQQVFDIEFAKGDNPAKNASEYWFIANYRLGGHYRLLQKDGFRLGVGGLWDINGGVLYNDRNGNNPATARGYTNLNLSAIASYKIKDIALRWQLDTPVVGMLFSPRYGQSYYEISLGNTVDVVNFSSLHNQRALRSYLTVDVPINKYIIRVGYLGSFYQTKVHNIQTHHYTNSFVLGFPIEGVKQSRSKAKNNYWNY